MIRRSFSHFHQQSGKLLERQRGLEDKHAQLLAQIRDLRAELEDVDQQLEIVKGQEMRLVIQSAADMQLQQITATDPPATGHPIGEPATLMLESTSPTTRISASDKAASKETEQAALKDNVEELWTENTTQPVFANARDEAASLNNSTTSLEPGIGPGAQHQRPSGQWATQRPQNIQQGNQCRKRLRSHGSEDYVDGLKDKPSNPDPQARAPKRPKRAAAQKSRRTCHDMCNQYPENWGDCDDEEELPDGGAAVVKEESDSNEETNVDDS